MDNLSLAAKNARDNKMSYGYYMANVYVPIISIKEEKQSKKPKYEKTCNRCGNVFFTDNIKKKYCCKSCYQDANAEQTIERYRAKRSERKNN